MTEKITNEQDKKQREKPEKPDRSHMAKSKQKFYH